MQRCKQKTRGLTLLKYKKLLNKRRLFTGTYYHPLLYSAASALSLFEHPVRLSLTSKEIKAVDFGAKLKRTAIQKTDQSPQKA